MQRLTTSGRRHNRAGSVTVAELIGKQPAPVRIRTRDQAAGHVLVTDPPADHTPAVAGRANRTAKLAGVATGAIVLLASVAAASILAQDRPTGPDQPQVTSPAPITGSTALRPDLLVAELVGGPVDRAPEPVGRTAPLAADQPPDVPAVVSPAELALGSQPGVDVVRRFFELLPTRPGDASRLLSPDLLGGDPRDFVDSWGQVQSITIESTRLRPDGAVLAVVSMQERTGRWIRVEQVFRLTDTTVPRIVGTEVVSAQRR
ncbi:hypothetical protein [Saccharothrix sp. HUAS TT1]|uniref:hypothetical protein n=1 Tax=unclassified Saccharothrix TaxID=2593673 RepID=UPI00345BFF4C